MPRLIHDAIPPSSNTMKDDLPALLLPPSRDRIDALIPGQPYSKARPRFTKAGKTYSPKEQVANAEMLGWYFRAACPRPFASNVALGAVFYRGTKQRVDVDNLLKQVLDAGNGILFKDDSQVAFIMGRIEHDRDNPRTLVSVQSFDSTLGRGDAADQTTECKRCGQSFGYRSYPSVPGPPSFCSQACRQRFDLTCPECQSTFKPQGPRQVYCSRQCASMSQSTRFKIAYAARKRARPPNPCRICAVSLAQRTAVLCRPCWHGLPSHDRRGLAGRARQMETEQGRPVTLDEVQGLLGRAA